MYTVQLYCATGLLARTTDGLRNTDLSIALYLPPGQGSYTLQALGRLRLLFQKGTTLVGLTTYPLTLSSPSGLGFSPLARSLHHLSPWLAVTSSIPYKFRHFRTPQMPSRGVPMSVLSKNFASA